jgi:uncharacterized membrane protein YraQ (UPF0718 family)
MTILETIWQGIANALLMAWTVWWALVLGFAISAIVQAWVPRERIERGMGESGARPVAIATGLGAASSSCSYAAIAIAKSLFGKGASAASALAFQFASTNLVVELGAVMWLLIGWQFTLAEFVGGLVMIVGMTLLLRFFVSERLEAQARAHAQAVEGGHRHCASEEDCAGSDAHEHAFPTSEPSAGGHLALSAPLTLGERLTSLTAWSEVARNFRSDWRMLYKEICVGFLLAGFIGLLGNDFFNALFITDAPAPLRLLENVLVGPLIAVLSFVCSVGNVPLAAVLWSGGISFAGVIAFIFADLIIVPIVLAYRKYYGRRFAARIVALMFLTMVVAALVVDGLFSAAGLIPHVRPSRTDIFGEVTVNYKLFTNVLGAVVFTTLFALARRGGARRGGGGARRGGEERYAATG